MLRGGLSAAKREIDEILRRSLARELARSVLYGMGGGWRALCQSAHGGRRRAGESRSTATQSARPRRANWLRSLPAFGGEAGGDPGVTERRGTEHAGGGVGARSPLETSGSGTCRLFRSRPARGISAYSQLSREEQYLDPLVEGAQLIGLPLARVPDFAPELVSWTAKLAAAETASEKRLRVAICALSDIAWRDAPDLRAGRVWFGRLLQFPFHRGRPPERERSSPRRSTLVTRAGRMRTGSTRPSACSRLSSGAGRKFLAVPFCSPTASPAACLPYWKARDYGSTRIASDWKSPRPRARPTAKWWSDRLRLLANAIGVKRSEVSSTLMRRHPRLGPGRRPACWPSVWNACLTLPADCEPGCLLVERLRLGACRSCGKHQSYCHRSGDGAYLMSDCHCPASLGFPGLTERTELQRSMLADLFMAAARARD